MEKLKAYRQKRGQSLRQLAVDLGLSHTFLHSLERGNQAPNLAIAKKIQKATGGAVHVRDWPHFREIADAVNST